MLLGIGPFSIYNPFKPLAQLTLITITGLITPIALSSSLPQKPILFNINGTWQQGELLIGKTDPKYQITFQKKSIMVSKTGYFIIGIDRDTKGEVELSITNESETSLQHYNIQPRQYNVQHIEGIAQNIMSPNAKEKQQARREYLAIKKARTAKHDRLDFLNPFIQPTIGVTTGVFGSQRVYNGKPGRPHYGWDIAAPVGTPVKASNSGIVIFSQLNTFYSGGLIIIDHGLQLTSSFLHLNDIYVKTGDEVTQGDIIGAVGATGRVTGAHLDWRMKWQYNNIDPKNLIDHPVLLNLLQNTSNQIN